LLDLASTVGDQHRFALEQRLIRLASDRASIEQSPEMVFGVQLASFRQLSRLGRWAEAEVLWSVLAETREDAKRAVAAHHRAVNLLYQGKLTEDELVKAEELSRLVRSALGCRNLCALRGWRFIAAAQWEAAKESLDEAVTLAHKAGKIDRRSEIHLALARYRLGELGQAREIADQLSNNTDFSSHLPLARLWLAIGEMEQAEVHATAAYKWAWGDGEPYAHWYECTQARTLLAQIGAKIPTMPRFSACQADILPWEADAERAIQTIQSLRHRRHVEENRKFEAGAGVRRGLAH
jgi:tetratricopeptide (TPR) repeat protein